MDDFINLLKSKLAISGGMEFIEKEIRLLFNSLKQTNSITEADLIFRNLEDIQFVLAQAVFKDGVNVSDFLRKFIYDFDRIDDTDVKKYQYNKIKRQG